MKRLNGCILQMGLTSVFSGWVVLTHAQVPGISEFYQASAEIKNHYFSLSDLSFVLGAIMGLLGGLRIFANWQSGRHHIDQQVAGWLFSCIFLNVCGLFLRGLFRL
jgi:hypothetical protein